MTTVGRDERTLAVENAGYRWGLNTVSIGLLLDVQLRGLIRYDVLPDYLSLVAANWDLMALVVLGGLVAAGYRAYKGTLWPQIAAQWRQLAILVGVVLVAQVGIAWGAIHWLRSHSH